MLHYMLEKLEKIEVVLVTQGDNILMIITCICTQKISIVKGRAAWGEACRTDFAAA